jgi:hypothetical protein
MSVDFFFDTYQIAKDWVNAINILTQEIPGYEVPHSFIDMWPSIYDLPRTAYLNGAEAILMQGTTSELQANLLYAETLGIQAISVPNDLLGIYYIRRKAGGPGPFGETKTIVSIAPMGRYWKKGQYVNDFDQTWYRLSDDYIRGGGISLDSLANQVLPLAQAVAAWYPPRT